jgi:translation elongation factor EF-Ts
MTVATASDVSSLRQKTGFPMMDCKKALADAGGDFEKAKDLLRERLGVSSITPQQNKLYLLLYSELQLRCSPQYCFEE